MIAFGALALITVLGLVTVKKKAKIGVDNSS